MKQKCKVSSCNREQLGQKPYCGMHQQRYLKHGNPLTKLKTGSIPRSLDERFWERVDAGDQGSCWECSGGKTKDGYPIMTVPGNTTARLHRISWEIHNGPIPLGNEIHHICGNRACVNPSHLDSVTRHEHATRHWRPTVKIRQLEEELKRLRGECSL